jgi:hypothetical protein
MDYETEQEFREMAKDFAMSDIGLTEDEAEQAVEDFIG